MSQDKQNVDYDGVENSILKLLFDRAPNNIRIKRVYEILGKNGAPEDQIDKAIDSLTKKRRIIKRERFSPTTPPVILDEVKRRASIELPNYSVGIPIKGDYTIGDASVVRLLSYDQLSAEDVNEVTEALVEYIDNINKTFDDRIREETAKIYRQMIGIFGVFVSIFAVIVISTDKMLRFSPDVLQQGWLTLFLKSSALFLPVGIVIGGLVFIVMRGTKK